MYSVYHYFISDSVRHKMLYCYIYVLECWFFCNIQDTRYFIFQIRAPGGHDTTFIISTYTINKVKYNNYFITIIHVSQIKTKGSNSSKIVLEFYIQFEYSIYSYIYIHIYIIIINNKCKQVFYNSV